MKQTITASNAPKALGPYSHGCKLGNIVFTSGQLGLDPETGKFAGASVEEQTEMAFKNLIAVLEAGGSKIENVVKCTVYLKDMNDFAKVNAIYANYFKSECPARTCVEVARLPIDALVEIEAIAFA